MAQNNPQVYRISLTSLLCPKGEAQQPDENGFWVCDDYMQKTRTYLRPDGSHIDTEKYGQEVAKHLMDQVDKVLQK